MITIIRFFIQISFILSCFVLHAQDFSDWNYSSKLQVRPSVGMNIPLTKLFNGTATDHLISYSDGATYYLQVIAITYFFQRNWGIEINYQGSSASKTRGEVRNRTFSKKVQNEYQEQYFVTPASGALYGDENFIGGNIQRGLVGVVYRGEFGKFIFYPKIAIGVTSFYTDWGEAYLKEKNSNTLLRVAYSPEKLPNDHFTSAISLTAGCKLSKSVFWNFEVMSSYYKTNFSYTKTTTNLNTKQSSSTKTIYKRDILNLSIGTGVTIVIE